jgi:asparagine N-glycosylation enzyme membrane subunit Stt3
MQILNTFLSILFGIHGLVFIMLYLRRKQLRLLLLVGTFSLLTVAFAMLAADFRPEISLFFVSLQLPTVLRIIAVITTLTALFLYYQNRKKKRQS